jgi:hypothetical protein
VTTEGRKPRADESHGRFLERHCIVDGSLGS